MEASETIPIVDKPGSAFPSEPPCGGEGPHDVKMCLGIKGVDVFAREELANESCGGKRTAWWW